jgi:glycerol-3-phosphate responsive antiterminator
MRQVSCLIESMLQQKTFLFLHVGIIFGKVPSQTAYQIICHYVQDKYIIHIQQKLIKKEEHSKE